MHRCLPRLVHDDDFREALRPLERIRKWTEREVVVRGRPTDRNNEAWDRRGDTRKMLEIASIQLFQHRELLGCVCLEKASRIPRQRHQAVLTRICRASALTVDTVSAFAVKKHRSDRESDHEPRRLYGS
jgi:hypothetical protein